jgi:prolyl oligopeptidase
MLQKTFVFLWIAMTTLGTGCTDKASVTAGATPEAASENDPYLFLEDRLGETAREWVKPRSKATVDALTAHPRYSQIHADIRSIRKATDRLATPDVHGDFVYNFWTDDTFKKGIWRRSPVADYDSGSPVWENLVDVGALSTAENADWVWKGASCFAPENRYCLVHLSDGGEDATVVREYDTQLKDFRKNGFALPKSKHSVAWWGEDELLIATDFGPGSLTKSEYARVVKRWKRGTAYTDAEFLFEGKVEDVAVGIWVDNRKTGSVGLVYRAPTFFEQQYSLLTDVGLKSLPLPLDAEVMGMTETSLLVRVRKDWTFGTRTLRAGALTSLPLQFNSIDDWARDAKTLYQPDDRSTLEGIAVTDSAVFLVAVTDVKARLLQATLSRDIWNISDTGLPSDGVIHIHSAEGKKDRLYVEYQSFLSTPTIYRGTSKAGVFSWDKVASLPARFDSTDMMSEQRHAVSKDGTRIPYFVVRKKTLRLDGSHPTLLYGYGGFEVSLLPKYSGEVGKTWLEQGGIYVVANIRGGGEFGSKWHTAAILEKRQKAYDDFIAVAEDLIQTKHTSAKYLGIRGGSNGGLLVGAVTLQRPELFGAVICAVPLLDMARYHLLPPGDSWTGEYGSVDDPKMAAVIRAYSPYQNIRRDGRYPKIYFWSSLRDDRVHPGHARKMVARMEEYGHSNYYYESTAGGHGGAGDIDQSVQDEAMAVTYLFDQLVDNSTK